MTDVFRDIILTADNFRKRGATVNYYDVNKTLELSCDKQSLSSFLSEMSDVVMEYNIDDGCIIDFTCKIKNGQSFIYVIEKEM